MKMGTGSIAKNFQQGARSEYLAQYVFSAFGTAVPVPRPEDSGLDLHCTLGRQEGRRFWVDNYYYVQVKSDEKDICFKGKSSVLWLLSLKLPLFICLVSKENQWIEVFQTVGVQTQYGSTSLKEIRLTFNQSRKTTFRSSDSSELFPKFDANRTKVCIDLGPPILRFSLSDFSSSDNTKLYRNCLESWVKIAQKNLDNLAAGFTIVETPDLPFYANHPIPQTKSFGGNRFHLSEENHVKYKDFLYKSLSTLLLEIAKEKDPVKFDEVRRLIGELIKKSEGRFTMGAINLVHRENVLAKKLGLEPHIHHPRVNILTATDLNEIEL